MDNFRIRPLSETDIDAVVRSAGGSRAHDDADRRADPGADYLLADTLLELKVLEDDGLEKPERQAKLAALFLQHERRRPVVVIDRGRLPEPARRDYDHIIEGPIKTGVRKARKQVKQSRIEIPAAKSTVFLLVNSGYTAIPHEEIVRLVAHRVRNDTKEIDGIVVCGCYFYSDEFDSYFLWPMDYIPVNIDRPFAAYEDLKTAWDSFAEDFMTTVVTGATSPSSTNGPVLDTQFSLDGVTYVKPAPPMGLPSGFFRNGRPRVNSSGITRRPPVGTAFPEMDASEWDRFRGALSYRSPRFEDYAQFRAERDVTVASGESLRPFVPVAVTCDAWLEWCDRECVEKAESTVFEYATVLFDQRVREILHAARQRLPGSVVPASYILAITEEIGRDRANDISHIAVVRESALSAPVMREIVTDARIFHEHAIALASAYALAEGIESVRWEKELTYAWT